MSMDLGYGDMWASLHKQAKEENWDKATFEKAEKEMQEGINAEINELRELGVLKE